jgi:hypothetical protein
LEYQSLRQLPERIESLFTFHFELKASQVFMATADDRAIDEYMIRETFLSNSLHVHLEYPDET